MASQSQAKEAVYLYCCVCSHLDAAIPTCVCVQISMCVCIVLHIYVYKLKILILSGPNSHSRDLMQTQKIHLLEIS